MTEPKPGCNPYIQKINVMKRKKLFSTPLLICCFILLSACGGNEKAVEKPVQVLSQEQDDKLDVPKPDRFEVKNAKQEMEAFSQPSPELQGQIRLLLNNYLVIKRNLAESSAEGASIAAKKLLANLKSFKEDKLPEDQKSFYEKKAKQIEKFLSLIADKKDLEEQRVHFSAITTGIYELTKTFKANEEPLYYQFCPMAFNNSGGYWLSDSKEIRNPYFGEKMLKCGSTTETISR